MGSFWGVARECWEGLRARISPHKTRTTRCTRPLTRLCATPGETRKSPNSTGHIFLGGRKLLGGYIYTIYILYCIERVAYLRVAFSHDPHMTSCENSLAIDVKTKT